MKTQKMQLNGVVYVKDPKDAEAIQRLKDLVAKYRKLEKEYIRATFKTNALSNKEKNINLALKEFKDQRKYLQALKNMKLSSFIHYSWKGEQYIRKASRYKPTGPTK